MKILGLEASGIVASVAVVEDDKLLGEYTINHKRTHSKTLMPMLEEMLHSLDMSIDSIDAIAVSAGPGSYTGLRISSSSAKGIAMALGKPIIPVETMQGLAYNMWQAADVVCPIVDARRRQVYTGAYRFEDGEIVTVISQQVAIIDELISELSGQAVTFLGDGVKLYRDIIIEHLGDKASFAPAHMNMPRASSIASLASLYAISGRMESATEHRPIYLMLSQAEKERLDAGEDIREASTKL